MFLSRHRQNGAHASPERGGHEIGGRKRFPFAPVVSGRVGRNLGVRWTVDRVAMQITGVLNADIDHARIWSGTSIKQ